MSGYWNAYGYQSLGGPAGPAGPIGPTGPNITGLSELTAGTILVNPSNEIEISAPLNLTLQNTSTVLVTDSSKNVISSSVNTTTLGYLDATSSIQTQINGKQTALTGLTSGDFIKATGTNTLGNSSILSESGSTLSVNGDIQFPSTVSNGRVIDFTPISTNSPYIDAFANVNFSGSTGTGLLWGTYDQSNHPCFELFPGTGTNYPNNLCVIQPSSASTVNSLNVNDSAGAGVLIVGNATPAVTVNGNMNVYGNGTCGFYGSTNPAVAGVINIDANSSTGPGNVNISGGNNATLPLGNNTTTISGGGSNGGTLNLGGSVNGNGVGNVEIWGGNNATQSNNTVSIAGSSTTGGGNVHINGNALTASTVLPGNVFIQGGNSASYGNNNATIQGGGSNGGTANLIGGMSATTADNIVNIGTPSYPQTIQTNGSILPTSYQVDSVGSASYQYNNIYGKNIYSGSSISVNGAVVNGSSTNWVSNGFNLQAYHDNANTCGVSGGRWSAVWSANGTIQTSDVNTKKNVQPLDSNKYGLDFINKLKPTTWNWKDGPDTTKTHHGFVFQDIKALVGTDDIGLLHDAVPTKHVVTGEDLPVYAGMNYSQLLAPMVNAIQTLTNENTELKSMMASLSFRIASIEAASKK